MADIPEPEYSIRITARLLIMTAITNASSPLKICLESSSSFVFITILSSNKQGTAVRKYFLSYFSDGRPLCLLHLIFSENTIFYRIRQVSHFNY